MAFSDPDTFAIYNGDGVTVDFPINFSFVDVEQVQAALYDVTDPSIPTLLPFANPANWSVVGNNVRAVVAPTSDQQIIVFRDTEAIHETLYNTYEFPFPTANNDLDTIYQIAQELKEELSRAVVNPLITEGGNGTVVRYEDLVTLINGGAVGRVTNVITSSVTAIANRVYIVKGAGVTVTLPAAPLANQVVAVKNRGNFSPVIAGNGNTIDGQAFKLLTQDQAIDIIFDGTEWSII